MSTQYCGQTAYSTTGKGPNLVLVHGLGLNRHMWQWQLGELEPHFRVTCLDLPGHGDSGPPAEPASMAEMVAVACLVIGF